MKPKIPFQFRSSLATTIFCGALLTHLAAPSASAISLFWDANGDATATTGGTGNWTGGSTWRPTSSTGTPLQSWADGNTASFPAASTITLNGSVAVTGLTNVTGLCQIIGSGSNTIDFGAGGSITTPGGSATAGLRSSALLKGVVTLVPNTGTLAQASAIWLKADNTELTSTTIAAGVALASVVVDSAGALGTSSSTVLIKNSSVLMLGALSSETIGSTAGSNSGSSYNAFTTTIEGGYIRSRVGSNTLNGPISITAAGSGLMTRAAAGVTLTLSSTATLNLNANTLNLNVDSASTGVIVNSVISGTGGLQTVGTGTVTNGANGTGITTLNAANTFSGTATTTTNLGTLALGNLNALQNATLNTGAASGTQGVTFVVAGTNTYNIGALSGADNLDNTGNTLSIGAKAADTTFSAIISGVGGVTKVGSNSLTLSGANNYTGATLVSGGTLNVSGSLTSAINVANNGTVGGEGSTTGNVVMSTGSALAFDPTTTGANQYFKTSGTIDATAGGVTLKVTTAVTSGTGIVIAEATGGWGASTNANFTLLARGTAYLSGNQLLYDFGIGNVTWKGNAANPTFWDLAVTQNWDNAGSPDVFLGGDNVTFDNSAATRVVAVQAPLAAGTLTFTNTSGNDYSLSGATLSATSLAKSGSGKVTVSNAVTLSGAATISTGTLQLGDGTNATGSLSSAITNNGALIASFGTNNVTMANTISGSGSLTKDGAGKVTFTSAVTYNGTTVINGGTLALSNTGLAALGANLDTVISGAGSVEKAGVGLLTVDTANTYSGTTTIAAGSVVLSGSGALGDAISGTSVSSGASLALSAGGTFGTGETLTMSGAGITVSDHFATGSSGSRGALQSISGSNTYAGNIELSANGTSRIGSQAGASLTLTGAITQASGITTANILFRVGENNGDFVTLSNAGNSFGDDSTIFTSLVVGAGNYAGVRLGITNALPVTLTIAGASASGSGTALDLAGYNQSLNGLITGTGSTSLKIINANTGTPSTLTLNPTVDKSSSNTTIVGGGSLGVINLVKSGTFIQTLTGVNSYSGNTTVNAGTLSLNTVNANNEASTVTIAATAFLNLTHASTDTVGKLFIGATQLAAGVYGNSSSILPVIGISQITGTGTLTVTSGPPASGYASWINGFFPGETNLAIIGVDADPDNDGIDNGVEMVIGGNPATGMDTALLPTIELVTNPVSTPAIPAGNYLLFTYRRSDLSVAGGVTSACETDTDLVGPWTTAIDGPSGVVIQVDDNFTFTPPAAAATDRVRVYVPRAGNNTLFGRIDVVIP